MRAKIAGVLQTEIFPLDDGYVAIQQENAVVRFAPDQLPLVIKELQACYDKREQWQEPLKG